jgi:hypothetical protein
MFCVLKAYFAKIYLNLPLVLYWKSEKQIHNNGKAISRSNNADLCIRAITIRSNNSTNMPGAINNKSDNASQQC